MKVHGSLGPAPETRNCPTQRALNLREGAGRRNSPWGENREQGNGDDRETKMSGAFGVSGLMIVRKGAGGSRS